MFTGIITDVGTVTKLEKEGDLRARIQTNYDAGPNMSVITPRLTL